MCLLYRRRMIGGVCVCGGHRRAYPLFSVNKNRWENEERGRICRWGEGVVPYQGVFSMAAICASDRPKWWPISWMST